MQLLSQAREYCVQLHICGMVVAFMRKRYCRVAQLEELIYSWTSEVHLWVCAVRPGHNALILVLASVSSSRMRFMASISSMSIPGR